MAIIDEERVEHGTDLLEGSEPPRSLRDVLRAGRSASGSPRRRGTTLLVIGLAAAIGAGFAVFFMVRGGDPATSNQAATSPGTIRMKMNGQWMTMKDDKGLNEVMNGEMAGGEKMHTFPTVKLDAATQAKLDAQLAQTRLLIAKYPTVAAAEAAGYHREGPYAPGIGAHYANYHMRLNFSGVIDDQTVQTPLLIFDGVSPDSKLAGFMYIAMTPQSQAPEGFAGPNDHWHYHENVCLVYGADGGIDAPMGADTTAPKSLCDKYGGHLIAYTGYMLHVWTVPGFESPEGVFSNVNSKLTCPDGTYYTVPQSQIGHRTNTCKDVPADA